MLCGLLILSFSSLVLECRNGTVGLYNTGFDEALENGILSDTEAILSFVGVRVSRGLWLGLGKPHLAYKQGSLSLSISLSLSLYLSLSLAL